MKKKKRSFGHYELNFDGMLQWVKDMMRVLPTPRGYSDKIRLSYTRLRPSKAVESVRLINDKEAFSK